MKKDFLVWVLVYVVRSNNDCFKQQLTDHANENAKHDKNNLGDNFSCVPSLTRSPRVSKRNLRFQVFIFKEGLLAGWKFSCLHTYLDGCWVGSAT